MALAQSDLRRQAGWTLGKATFDRSNQVVIASMMPLSLESRVGGTIEFPVGPMIDTLGMRGGTLLVTLRDAALWGEAALSVRLVGAYTSPEDARPLFARDAAATARITQANSGSLVAVPVGDLWSPLALMQTFIRWEQGNFSQGIPGIGYLDVVLAQNPMGFEMPPGPRNLRGLQLWLRADAGIRAQGTTINTWQDQSGNNFDAATAFGAPLLVEGALNGCPGVFFDGASFMQTVPFPLTTFTMFAVFRGTGTPGILVEHSVDANNNPGSAVYTSVGSTITVNRANTISAKDLTPQWGTDNVNRVLRHEYAGTHATNALYLNGSQQSMTDTVFGQPGSSSTGDQPLSIGARPGLQVPLLPLNGHVMEVVVYSPALDPADALALERTYFGPRYGLTIA